MYPKKLALVMTRDCNLCCSYCYVRKSKTKIKFEQGKKVLSSFLKFPGSQKEVIFTGGEPLLTFPTVKKLILFSQQYKNKNNKKIKFFFLTNGIGLNKKHLDFFQKHNVEVQLSLDGEKNTQDLHRKTPNGGSFNILKSKLPILKEYNNISINAVFTPETIKHLYKNIKFFYKYFHKVRLSYAYDANWSKRDLIEFSKVLDKILEWYLKIREKKRFVVENIECLINKNFVSEKQKKDSICDTICYSADGLYFSCLLFLNLDKKNIKKISFSSLKEGLPLAKRMKMLERWSAASMNLVNVALGSNKKECGFCVIPFYVKYGKKEFIKIVRIMTIFNRILIKTVKKKLSDKKLKMEHNIF